MFDRDVVGPLERVTAPPYDVIGESAAREYLDASTHNVVRLDIGDRDGAGDRYARAGGLLQAWRREGALVPHPNAYFAYEMRFHTEKRSGRIRGVLCALEIEEWGKGIVPHERTMAAPVDDRLRLMRATEANISPVYGVVDGPRPALAKFLDRVTAAVAGWSLFDEEGVAHRMWSVPAHTPIAEWLAGQSLLIADGHHRYETALRYRDERRATDGSGPWDRVLALVVDASVERPPVLPYHRIVRRGGQGAPLSRGRRTGGLDEMLAGLRDDDLLVGMATMEDGDLVHRVVRLDGEPPAVRALHRQVLDPTHVGDHDLAFTPDAARAESAVLHGAAAAYFLPPTTTERIRAVIERGDRLPQKSTFFWPKPRTGMAIRPL